MAYQFSNKMMQCGRFQSYSTHFDGLEVTICVMYIVYYDNQFTEYSTMNTQNGRDWIDIFPNSYYFNLI